MIKLCAVQHVHNIISVSLCVVSIVMCVVHIHVVAIHNYHVIDHMSSLLDIAIYCVLQLEILICENNLAIM